MLHPSSGFINIASNRFKRAKHLDDDDVKIEGSKSDQAPIAHIEYKFKTSILFNSSINCPTAYSQRSPTASSVCGSTLWHPGVKIQAPVLPYPYRIVPYP